MVSANLLDFKNQSPAEFETLADQVGAFVLDQNELRELLDTAGRAAKETETYKNLQGLFLRREIMRTAPFGNA
ncbi:hypothetical protein GO013_00085 [Pseudodesulfovibrio sp. JC047]|uniref:hypothetical protein n=1 Tax=Pseudodesulfovibrio sp. JC047 TaxID=2683199 RepID=UPI0013D36B91|nr:hypothetical protein [Pseudodesulfovibrio sp. JC047]NDV17816.1 hypothetical protein [Pseudodesulfovibrio sp. JC047]